MKLFETCIQFETKCSVNFIKNLVNFVRFYFSIYLHNFTCTKIKKCIRMTSTWLNIVKKSYVIKNWVPSHLQRFPNIFISYQGSFPLKIHLILTAEFGNDSSIYGRRQSSNYLNTKPTKLSNTLTQFVGKSGQIVWVCLTILLDWRLKG